MSFSNPLASPSTNFSPSPTLWKKVAAKLPHRPYPTTSSIKSAPSPAPPKNASRRIQQYQDAGATHIMLEIWGDDRTGQAKLFGEKVLPHFRR